MQLSGLEVALVSGALTLSGYSQLISDFSGLTCMGTNNDTIIEALGNHINPQVQETK